MDYTASFSMGNAQRYEVLGSFKQLLLVRYDKDQIFTQIYQMKDITCRKLTTSK